MTGIKKFNKGWLVLPSNADITTARDHGGVWYVVADGAVYSLGSEEPEVVEFDRDYDGPPCFADCGKWMAWPPQPGQDND